MLSAQALSKTMNRIATYTLMSLLASPVAIGAETLECNRLRLPSNSEHPCPEANPPIPSPVVTAKIRSTLIKKSRLTRTDDHDLLTGEVTGHAGIHYLDIAFSGEAGVYFLQSTEDITSPNWETITPVLCQSGEFNLVAPISKEGFSNRGIPINGFLRMVYIPPEAIYEFVRRLSYTEDPNYRVLCCGDAVVRWLEYAVFAKYEKAYDVAHELGVSVSIGGWSGTSREFKSRFPIPSD